MQTTYDLSSIDWKLYGWVPYLWKYQAMILGKQDSSDAQIAVNAKVPGSVQYSLFNAGALPDWNKGLNAQACEWVENRHWIYETTIPDEWLDSGKVYRLRCEGLDYCGEVFLNGKLVQEFCSTQIPHTFDLTKYMVEHGNVLRIIFTCPPRWLGQIGYTSRMTEWKTRFNYTWDWIPRLVQIGIWDSISLEVTDGLQMVDIRCTANADMEDSTGRLRITGQAIGGDNYAVRVTLSRGSSIIREEDVPVSVFSGAGINWQHLPVELWWPNMEGEQPLYTLTCILHDTNGKEHDRIVRRIGFRNISWAPCEGAPEDADPWICMINGRPVFLQGVNFTAILPNFADVTEGDYRKLLNLYKDLGVNILRINACGFLEKEIFYDICDELGLMVWQEFPLTSSGIENIPPSEKKSIDEMAAIAESFIARRQHHPSLILWSGGNELADLHMRPLGTGHPMLARLQKVVEENDPDRRYVPASPSGPRFMVSSSEVGKGLHWDTHGPWGGAPGNLSEWAKYWEESDSLFYSEIGMPGTSSVDIIREYAGGLDELPVSPSNPLWNRPVTWWIESELFESEFGHAPESLEEYVDWSRQRQADALSIAVKACKSKFPRCGGVILWTGHDCYPCSTNLSIVDFKCQPKPAALALAEIWKSR